MRKGLGVLIVLVSTACSNSGGSEAVRVPGAAETPAPELITGQGEATTTTEPTTSTTVAPEPVVEVSTTVAYAPPTTATFARSTATTAHVAPPVRSSSSSELADIRACEQNDNPAMGPTGYASDTGNGYYGAYQFTWSTWASVGGTGNPAHASPTEQDMRAQMMIDAGRRGEWPNC